MGGIALERRWPFRNFHDDTLYNRHRHSNPFLVRGSEWGFFELHYLYFSQNSLRTLQSELGNPSLRDVQFREGMQIILFTKRAVPGICSSVFRFQRHPDLIRRACPGLPYKAPEE